MSVGLSSSHSISGHTKSAGIILNLAFDCNPKQLNVILRLPESTSEACILKTVINAHALPS